MVKPNGKAIKRDLVHSETEWKTEQLNAGENSNRGQSLYFGNLKDIVRSIVLSQE